MDRRQEKIVEDMRIQSDDRVLEIGYGHGVAASFICQSLDTGLYVGIDRSQKMADAATRRNQEYVNAGKATFLVQELEELDLGDQKFDKILAVRVGLFHREPERARQIVAPYLAENGELTVIYDTPN